MNTNVYDEVKELLKGDCEDLIKYCTENKTLDKASDLIDALAMAAYVNCKMVKLLDEELQVAENHIMNHCKEDDDVSCACDCECCDRMFDCVHDEIISILENDIEGLEDFEDASLVSKVLEATRIYCDCNDIEDEAEILELALNVLDDLETRD